MQSKGHIQIRKNVWQLVMIFSICLGLAVYAAPVQSDGLPPVEPAGELGPAPMFPNRASQVSGQAQQLGEAAGIAASPSVDLDKFLYLPGIYRPKVGFSVNPANRQESLDFYRQYYLVPRVNPGWTGNVNSCTPGTTSQAFRDALALRLNYFRAMAGVPAQVSLLDEYNRKAQQAALMMSANSALSHDPPTSWKCYTAEGHEAAGNSNLALGNYGVDALSLYMKDPGAGNSVVGHRRWILYPQTQNMGTGDIPSGSGITAANDLWVFDSHLWESRPTTREAFVAWPPPGYVPYTIVYPRWSFSYAGANFANAAVSMTENGANVAVTRYTPQNGYGENTLVWIISSMNEGGDWPKPAADTTYVVTVSNVVIGGSPRSFQYTVIIFDP